MKKLLLQLFCLLGGFLFANPLSAQWTSDTTVNLNVMDTTGEQGQPKIAHTKDGGLYVSWFDNRSGSYAVYLQRLDSNGYKMFPSTGLLISGANAQSSSLVDYDMIADDSDNAIITFTDTRKNASNRMPFVYKVNSAGNFLWGANGVDLNADSAGATADPKVVQTKSGDYVVVWTYISPAGEKTALQRLNRAGAKQWSNGEPMLLPLPSGANNAYQQICSSDSTAIVSWSFYTGSFLSAGNYKILTQKYDMTGQPKWTLPFDTVYNLGGVPGFYKPKMVTDYKGGAVYTWEAGPNTPQQDYVYVQHLNSAGVAQFAVNGIYPAAQTGNQFDPQAAYDTSDNTVVVFWQATNSTQSLQGFYGQKLSSTGAQLWTNTGFIAQPLDVNGYGSGPITAYGGNAYGAYTENIFGSGNYYVKAFKVNAAGTTGWNGIITSGASLTPKTHMVDAMDPAYSQFYMAWEDTRNSNGGGIYAQNIKFDGDLGVPTTLAATVDTVLCAGKSINVSYNAAWTYNTGNQFIIKLSDANGSFTSATTLGTVTGTTSGSFTGTLPSTLPTGNDYHIEVIATNPPSVVETSTDSITINALPTVTLHLVPDSIYILSTGVQLTGGLPLGGTYYGAGVDNIGFFTPSVADTGWHTITYVYINGSGCSDTATEQIYVQPSLGVHTLSLSNSVHVYPNPVQNTLFIHTDKDIKNGNLKVYNVLGQLMQSNPINLSAGAEMNMDVHTWPSGIYEVRIEDGQNNTLTTQVVK